MYRNCQTLAMIVLLISLSLFVLPEESPAGGTPDLDEYKSTGNSNNVSLVSRWARGPNEAIAVAGDYLFVGDGSEMRIFSLTNPALPSFVARHDMPSPIRCLYVWGNYLGVGTHSDGMRFFDITTPTSPSSLFDAGEYGVYGAAMANDRLYLACGGDGVQAYDVPGMTGATLVTTFDDNDYYMDVEVNGGYLLIATGNDGLAVLDLDELDGPLVATLPATGPAQQISVSGTTAWVASHSSGVFSVDIADQTAPVLLDTYDTTGSAYALVVNITCLYVADNYSGFTALNVADRTDISLLDTHNTVGGCVDVAINGSYAYVADDAEGFIVVDISDPTILTEVYSLQSYDATLDIALDGDYAYLANDNRGIVTLDLSDPFSPILSGGGDPGGTYNALVHSGGYLYAAGGWKGLEVIDITIPGTPTSLGYEPAAYSHDVDVVGTRAYLSCAASGVVQLDVSDPADPVPTYTFDTDGSTLGLCAVSTYVLCADGSNGLVVIDFTAGAPVELAHLDTEGQAYDCDYSFPYVFLADGTDGLKIIDWGNTPASPTLVAAVVLDGSARDVKVDGDYAYVTCWEAGLYVVNISSPLNPVVSGWYDTGHYATGLAIKDGRFAVVADKDNGVLVLRNNDLTPTFLANISLTRTDHGAELQWQLSLQSDGAFQVWRSVNGQAREPVSNMITGTGTSFNFVDTSAPIGEAGYWLHVVETDGRTFWFGPYNLSGADLPRMPSLSEAVPNPFNPCTSFRVTMPEPGHARLAIYDVQGRRVATLLEGRFAGEREIIWNGRGDRGNDLPTGVYLACLETENKRETRKISLVR